MGDREPTGEAERLQALGTVAAELFHDLASELAVVEGRVAAAKQEARQGTLPHGELEALSTDAERIRAMVQDVLDELGGRTVSPEAAFDPAEVARKAVQAWRPTAPSVDVSISSDLQGSGGVQGRHSFLERALLNLLRNAARHARSRVHVSLEPGASEAEMVIRVEDDGDGIADELAGDSLFQPFVTGNGERTGLGLSVVSWCARALGGHVENGGSQRLGGAYFALRLPLHASPMETAGRREVPDLRGLRVAVVDDDPALRRMYRRLLGRAGAEVRTIAPGGPEGLTEQLLSSTDDVVLLDVNLGVVSGVDVWRAVWDRDPGRASRLVLVTGYGPEELTVPGVDECDRPAIVSKLAHPADIAASLRAAAAA